MSAVLNICRILGRKQIAARVGVGITAVGNAVAADVFPASWFAVISDMCEEVGIDCPRDAFGWKVGSDEAAVHGEARSPSSLGEQGMQGSAREDAA